MIGGSAFIGNTGQDQSFDVDGDGLTDANLPGATLTLWEAHSEVTTHGLRVRGLFTMSHLKDAGSLTGDLLTTGALAAGDAIAENTLGGYGEVGYEVLQWIAPNSGWTVEPFVRAEYIDTQYDMPSGFDANKSEQFQVYTVGVSAKPIPERGAEARLSQSRGPAGTAGRRGEPRDRSCLLAAVRAIGISIFAALCLTSGTAHAKVFLSRSEALALAFPDADRIEDESILLGDEQAGQIERLAKSRLESRLVRIHRGYRQNELLGYAIIDVHNVRTLPEAFLVVLSPEGAVRNAARARIPRAARVHASRALVSAVRRQDPRCPAAARR